MSVRDILNRRNADMQQVLRIRTQQEKLVVSLSRRNSLINSD